MGTNHTAVENIFARISSDLRRHRCQMEKKWQDDLGKLRHIIEKNNAGIEKMERLLRQAG